VKYTKQRVRDLSDLKPKKPSPREHVVRPPAGGDELLDGPMQHDMIYDPTARQDIENRFPHAEIETTHDWLKGTRLLVRVENCTLRSWLKFVISEGWGPVSFICQFMILDKPRLVEEILDDINPGWREKKR
jgi:hypothetical protein